jgi:hypothetical protein
VSVTANYISVNLNLSDTNKQCWTPYSKSQNPKEPKIHISSVIFGVNFPKLIMLKTDTLQVLQLTKMQGAPLLMVFLLPVQGNMLITCLVIA